MSLFRFDIPTFVGRIFLEPVKRKYQPYIDLIVALLEPMQTQFNDFNVFADRQQRRARYNGQVIVMRQAIIDFTGIQGIEVSVSRGETQRFFFLPSESQPQHLFTRFENEPYFVFLANEADFAFTIGVPSAQFTTQVETLIRTEVDRFGLPLQNYTIIGI